MYVMILTSGNMQFHFNDKGVLIGGTNVPADCEFGMTYQAVLMYLWQNGYDVPMEY